MENLLYERIEIRWHNDAITPRFSTNDSGDQGKYQSPEGVPLKKPG